MNEPAQKLNCPRCGNTLSGSSGVVCPHCNEVLKLYGDGSDDPVVRKTLAKMRYCWIASIVLFFAPPVGGGLSLMLGATNFSVISFYASPVFGVLSGVHFGTYLYYKNGAGLAASFVLGLIGAIVCPVMTFAGCALGGSV